MKTQQNGRSGGKAVSEWYPDVMNIEPDDFRGKWKKKIILHECTMQGKSKAQRCAILQSCKIR